MELFHIMIAMILLAKNLGVFEKHISLDFLSSVKQNLIMNQYVLYTKRKERYRNNFSTQVIIF